MLKNIALKGLALILAMCVMPSNADNRLSGKLQQSRDSVEVSFEEMVDLGLSVKWAGYNLGAESPEESGDYYSWGETETKRKYTTDRYTGLSNDTLARLGHSISGSNYDAAFVQSEGKWRMPTEDEFKELCERCSWVLGEYEEVPGYMVTGPNGNTIFLPFAGEKNDRSINGKKESCGISVASNGNSNGLSNVFFISGGTYEIIPAQPYVGRVIRPVCDVAPAVSSTQPSAPGTQYSQANIQQTLNGSSVQSLRNRLSNALAPSGSAVAAGSNAQAANNGVHHQQAMQQQQINQQQAVQQQQLALQQQVNEPAEPLSYAANDDAVDLGLSVRWATSNLGATTPTARGYFYAWGELEPKECYDKSTYTYYDAEKDSYIEIGENISGSEYDAARALRQGNWRIPTVAECEELVRECEWSWVQIDGVSGYKVTGPNGKSIFMPLAGYYSGSEVSEFGSYWTGAPDSGLGFNPEGPYIFTGDRFKGRTIRPVCD